MCYPSCNNVDAKTLPNGRTYCQKHYDEVNWFKNTMQAQMMSDDIDTDCNRCGREMKYGEMQDINGNKTHLICQCGNKQKVKR